MNAESSKRAVEQAAGAGTEHMPALPELELKVLRRSEKPITRENRTGVSETLKLESLRPWHNYTIVTLEGSDTIHIFDEDAKPIQDFAPPVPARALLLTGEK